MKKIYFALAVLVTALLSSCVEEKSFNDVNIGKNDLVFSMQGAASTRSAAVGEVQKGVIFELDADDNGQKLFMEETVEDLNNVSLETRSTPAYTENVGTLYKKLGAVIMDGETVVLNTTEFNALDNEMYGNGWRYSYEDFSGWPDEAEKDLDFYLWMPVSDNGITGSPTYGKANGKQTISFKYQTPATAAAQKDLLFAARPLNHKVHNSNLPNGAPVFFNHALTAVKFAIANYSATDKITIKSVSFTGLYGSGDCVITPANEGDYRDDKNTYSSSAEGVVVWTTTGTTTGTYSSASSDTDTFGAPVNFEDGSFENNGSYPTSFTANHSGENNLNDNDATKTFWFIPQAMTNNVVLTIKYTFGSDEVRTGKLEFGKALSGVTWKAGQLRTYTIRVDEVNVKIEDKVVPTATPDTELIDSDGNVVYKVDADGLPTEEAYTFTAYGGTKSNVVITNTGNTDAYIRAAIVGQWLDDQGRPVFGFTDAIGNIYLVDSWYQDQFVNHKGVHGYFVDLAGYRNDDNEVNKTAATQCTNPLHDWYLCGDGYYYYKNIVPAGQAIPSDKPLFTSYTVGRTPAVLVAGEVKNVYFQLEISTQAISAKKSDGSSYATWQEAWARTNTTNTAPTYVEITAQNGQN